MNDTVLQMNNITLLIDFDSTFVSVESLDVLAEIVLQKRSDKEEVLCTIQEITALGMEGKISFPESLSKRMKLFRPTQNDVAELVKILHGHITPSVKKYKAFFKRHKNSVYILSSGFRDYMIPVVSEFGIPEDHVFGNQFVFDTQGEFLGFDAHNVLAGEKGKVKKIKEQELQGLLYMIGDGHTDWEVKEAGLVEKFFAFTENVTRESVVKKADVIAASFEEVLKYL